jgi:hypothetical protein
MNKLNSALIAFSAICVLTPAAPVLASEFQAVHVKVPFAFTAGSTTLPAGDYTVSEGDTYLVRIHGSGGVATVFSTVTSENSQSKQGLTFLRTQKGFVLKSFSGAGQSSRVTTPER